METLIEPLETETPVADRDNRLECTSSKAMASMRFELKWETESGRHRDCFVGTNINLWRDIFPPELEQQIMDRPIGHRASHEFAPGELVPGWRADRQIRIRSEQFNRRFGGCGLVQPRAGRFYPTRALTGVNGVYREDWHPLRVLDASGDKLLVDLNHPLADRRLELDVLIQDIWAAGAEHGGRCNEIGEMVCDGGPGLQARWRHQKTDFWSDLPNLRQDPRPDPELYAQPRFVDHLDRTALDQVSGLYG